MVFLRLTCSITAIKRRRKYCRYDVKHTIQSIDRVRPCHLKVCPHSDPSYDKRGLLKTYSDRNSHEITYWDVITIKIYCACNSTEGWFVLMKRFVFYLYELSPLMYFIDGRRGGEECPWRFKHHKFGPSQLLLRYISKLLQDNKWIDERYIKTLPNEYLNGQISFC